ncbi:T9SS type A sorting domain-containing protein [bacterium]|nr:T9SS type A sorting domain-containing protein [bacterium]
MRFPRITLVYQLCLTLLFHSSSLPATEKDDPPLRRTAKWSVAESAWIDVGAFEFGIASDGRLAYNPDAGEYQGLYYPKGQRRGSVVYCAGPLIAGKIAGEVRCATGHYSREFTPGPFGSGGAGLNGSSIYGIFEFYPGESIDPAVVALGCPTDVLGDQMLFCVYNDANPDRHYFSDPMNLEVRQTVWAYGRAGIQEQYFPLSHAVFLHYSVVNKGQQVIDSCYFGIFCDADNGDANDDMTGCDTTGMFGFLFNGDGYDDNYGKEPPAIAVEILSGPLIESEGDTAFSLLAGSVPRMRNLPMTAYTPSLKNQVREMNDPYDTDDVFQFLQGRKLNGVPYFDPVTGLATTFPYSGDPVTGTGWLLGNEVDPYDSRFGVSCGPVRLQPGETAEYMVAIILGRGSSNLGSIVEMRRNEQSVQQHADHYYPGVVQPPSPLLRAGELDEEIVLYWDTNAGSYSSYGYALEGYNVWQGESWNGPWKKIAVFDLKNDVRSIIDWSYTDYYTFPVEIEVQQGTNSGLAYALQIKEDALEGRPLINGRSYWFAVTGYGYDPDGVPKTLESELAPVEAVPRRQLLDSAVRAMYGQEIPVSPGAVSGWGVCARVIDPNLISGHDYEVRIEGGEGNAAVWDLVDVTEDRAVLEQQRHTAAMDDPDDYAFPVADGLQVRVFADASAQPPDAGDPVVFAFSTNGLQPLTGRDAAASRLRDITVFPNPFFALNRYSAHQYDQHVTFSNLPADVCTIRIFTLNGELVRTLEHDNGTSFKRWDLENEDRFPVVSGMYIAAVETVYGRRILKLAVIGRRLFLPYSE